MYFTGNRSIFYGKDMSSATVINTCRRYPMFAERQVVLIKEAQQMKDIEKLEAYIESPLLSTVFVVGYKEKKLDARKKFAKLIKEKGVLITTKKMYDSQLPEWTQELLQSKGLTISQKGLVLLVDHIGNDLTRIENEINKISVNLGKKTTITEEDIERYIGVSKDFNVFELQSALAAKDIARSIRIIQYFEGNPKAAPIQLVLPSLYSFFSKLLLAAATSAHSERELVTALKISPFAAKDYINALRKYSLSKIISNVSALKEADLKLKGVNSGSENEGQILRELMIRLIH